MYKLQANGFITRVEDGAFIPADEGNIDYRAYQAWVAEGNTPEQATAPAVDPNAALQAQIDAIERATMVPRVMREFLLVSAELEAGRQAKAMTDAGHPVTAAELLAKNVGYMKTKSINDQIVQLREQMQ